MTENAIWIQEREVVDLLDLPSAIDALKGALRLQDRGEAQDMAKTHVRWGANTLHAIGASIEGAGLAGTKTWAYTTGGATPLLLLWDAGDGGLVAIIEAFALGQLRTASVSAAATSVLARPDAKTFAIIGTGKQAFGQVAAVLSVRDIRTITVHSPNAAHREAFSQRVADRYPALTVRSTATVAETVKDADVITTATRATSPFLKARDVASGAHVNAVGAITPDRQEIAADLVRRCGAVATDNLAAAQRLATEFRDVLTERDWDAVQPLSTLVSTNAVRPADCEVTLFKAMGIGLADVALGQQILRAAREAGAGRPIPTIMHDVDPFQGPEGRVTRDG